MCICFVKKHTKTQYCKGHKIIALYLDNAFIYYTGYLTAVLGCGESDNMLVIYDPGQYLENNKNNNFARI